MDETTQPTEAAPPTSPPVAADSNSSGEAVPGGDDNPVLLDGRTPPASPRNAAPVDSGKVAVVEAVTDYSVRPEKASELTSQPKVKLTSQSPPKPKAEVVELNKVKARLTSQSRAEFSRSKWKRSRVKKGWMIKRFQGYNINETEYGVSYLYVLSRKPDKTSADYSVYPRAGFFNWQALTDSGLLVKEKNNDRKTGTK